MSSPLKTVKEKALYINLDPSCYGAIVEIGAGQEVARQFFSVGAAAGTVAKTMSAYDMQISDDIYGKADRYVGRNRLLQMLQHEYSTLLQRLSATRPQTRFFSYAATVTARNYRGDNECHGWIGLRWQHAEAADYSEILLHVRMLDNTNALQSDALGRLGVNLIYGAYYLDADPRKIIASLLDDVGQDRLEIDLIHFEGALFADVDNRLMNLQLIHAWATRAVMFDRSGCSIVPRDALYKRPVLVTRGSFKPPTKVHADMSSYGIEQFCAVQQVDANNVVRLAEITLSELVTGGKVEDSDFISRVDLLTQQGYTVLISDYVRFFRLRSWLRQYTVNQIGIVLSVLDFNYLFDASFYEGLEGGILEAMGKLFPDNTHVYVYPAIIDGCFVDLHNVTIDAKQQRLLQYLIENQLLVPFLRYRIENLHISARQVWQQIAAGAGSWEQACTADVVALIKAKGLFGYPV